MKKIYSLFTIVMTLLFLPFSNAQIIQVGTGTNSSSTNPLNSCYGYNYTQQIYSASEVLAANSNATPTGVLNRVKFQINSLTTATLATNNFNVWTVYIGFVAQNEFTGGTNWVPLANMTQVYTGTITFPNPYANNWIDIALATPLTWNGTSNIVVAVQEQVPSWNCTMYFNSHSTTTNKAIYFFSDGTIPSAAAPPSGTVTTNRPNVQFYFQEAPCAPASAYPASASTVISKPSVCLGKYSTVRFQPATPMPALTGLTYQLQSSTNITGPWTNVGTPVVSAATEYSVNPSVSTYYRIQVLCNGTAVSLVSSPSLLTIVTSSGITASPFSRCGPGNVTLTATPTAGNTVLWYPSLTANLPSHTGSSVSAYFAATSTIYVAQGIVPTIDTVVCGLGANTGSTNACTPFNGGWGGYKYEYLIRESELAALGITSGTTLYSLGLQVRSGGTTYRGFQISLGSTTATALTATYVTGTTVVKSAFDNVVTIGNNYYEFDAPYVYTGGNLVVQMCWSNNNSSNVYSYVVEDGYSYVCTHYSNQDNQAPATLCGVTSGGSLISNRPKFYFRTLNKCEGPRSPVTVTIGAAPLLDGAAPRLTCANGIAPLTITSPASNYNNHTWSVIPAGGSLFTDAAATNAYVANANASALYFKSATPGNYKIIIIGNNTITGCNNRDTLEVNVLPATIAVSANDPIFCRTGATILKVTDSLSLNGAPLQWQESTNNITFTNISGATGFHYVTPTLTATKYYRLNVSGSLGSCTVNLVADTVKIENPGFSVFNNVSSCDTGIFNLSVTPQDTNFVVKWYDIPTASTPIHTGSSYTTPNINASTTYYVSASGAPVPAEGKIGTGTGTLSGNPNPYYTLYYGHRNQYLVLASELQAIGLGPGVITSLGFEVVAAAGLPLTNFTIKMGQTALTTMTATWQTGLTQVFTTGVFNPVANTNSRHVFQTPFVWDGVSNVIIETCFNNTSWSSGHSVKYTSGHSFNTATYGYADANNVCSNASLSAYTSTDRPNLLLEGTKSCEGARLPLTVTILPKTRAVVSPANSVAMCENGTATIRSANVGSSYKWLRNGIEIPNATADTLVISSVGSYRLVLFNNTCPDTSLPVSVVVNPLPIVNLGNDTSLCPNTPTTLNAQNLSSSVVWDDNSTNHVRTVTNAGTYFVTVTNSFGCKAADTLVISPLPVPQPRLGSDTFICENDRIRLEPGLFHQYLWSNNATTPFINIVDSGTYYVTVTNTFGCKNADTIKVAFSDKAFLEGFSFVPYFYEEQGKVQFNPINPRFVSAYLWDFGDSATSTLMNPMHRYARNSNYTVKVTVSNNTCPSRTYDQIITIDFSTDINSIKNVIATLYPNPAQDKVTIALEGSASKVQSVTIVDNLGRQYNIPQVILNNSIELNTSVLTSGRYSAVLNFVDGQQMSVKFEIVK